MRSFAIIPAAGQSRRMGEPKLLLPLAGRPLMAHTLAAWRQGGVTHCVAVVRAQDTALQTLCRAEGACVVAPPAPPPEMKDSVACALAFIAQQFAPAATDAWLLAPADVPELAPNAVAQLLAAQRSAQPEILVATYEGRRGHPVLFPWALAAAVAQLGAHEGVSALLGRFPVREIAIAGKAPTNVNTPADYAQAQRGAGDARSRRE